MAKCTLSLVLIMLICGTKLKSSPSSASAHVRLASDHRVVRPVGASRGGGPAGPAAPATGAPASSVAPALPRPASPTPPDPQRNASTPTRRHASSPRLHPASRGPAPGCANDLGIRDHRRRHGRSGTTRCRAERQQRRLRRMYGYVDPGGLANVTRCLVGNLQSDATSKTLRPRLAVPGSALRAVNHTGARRCARRPARSPAAIGKAIWLDYFLLRASRHLPPLRYM